MLADNIVNEFNVQCVYQIQHYTGTGHITTTANADAKSVIRMSYWRTVDGGGSSVDVCGHMLHSMELENSYFIMVV